MCIRDRVYSTCTFDPEENEKNIQFFLDHHADFSIEPLKEWKEGFSHGRIQETQNQEMEQCVRMWPHKAEGEGHFAALLKKEQNKEDEIKQNKMKVKNKILFSKETESFFEQIKIPLLSKKNVTNYDGKLYPVSYTHLGGIFQRLKYNNIHQKHRTDVIDKRQQIGSFFF